MTTFFKKHTYSQLVVISKGMGLVNKDLFKKEGNDLDTEVIKPNKSFDDMTLDEYQQYLRESGV